MFARTATLWCYNMCSRQVVEIVQCLPGLSHYGVITCAVDKLWNIVQSQYFVD